MHIVFLILDGCLYFVHGFIDGGKDGLTDLFKLLSGHIVAKIFIFHQAFDVDFVLSVTGQDLSLFFDVLHHL